MDTGASGAETSKFKKEISPFINYHIGQIKQGGLTVMLRKIRRFLALLLSIPAVLLIRALRPLVLIRIGPLKSAVIGYLAANPELYLCRRDAGIENKRAFDIFYHLTPVSNQQLKKMWDRTLRVWRLAGPVDVLNGALPGGKIHSIPLQQFRDRGIR